MAINHRLIDENSLVRANEIVNRRKLARCFPNISVGGKGEDELLLKALESFEFEAIDVWNSQNNGNRKTFVGICGNCFDIIQVLPIPGDELNKVKHVLQLIAYGYLGERWEAARRFLLDNEEKLMIDAESEKWNEKLLMKIYLAIFYIINCFNPKNSRQNSFPVLT